MRILTMTLCVATALPAAAQSRQPGADGKPKNGVYIVQLRDDPAIAYEGDVPGLAATKPDWGQKIDPQDERVRNYVGHLRSRHDTVLRDVGASGDKVYSYSYSFNGFAARLTPTQVADLLGRDDVVRVWHDELRQPQTDTSHAFLGLSGRRGLWRRTGLLGEDVVVGVIDTGIWPEHPSFADAGDPPGKRKGWKGWKKGFGRSDDYRYREPRKEKHLDREQERAATYGAPPEQWVGDACEFGNTAFNPADATFDCNDKLLGARFFVGGFSTPGTADGTNLIPGEYLSARDNDGHGSHVASTASGNLFVPAEIQGESLGRVSGMAPRARVAAYKVCWNGSFPPAGFQGGCFSSDSMAAIDQAVADGVDVINFSIGGSSTAFTGPDDVAFLFAADAGVFVAVAAGNSGPGASTVDTPGGVPWVTGVGAAQDDGVFNPGLEVSEPSSAADTYEGVEGNGPVTIEDAGTVTGDLVPAEPLNACGPLTNGAAMSGNIALVIRGACGFNDKYLNAQAAGADAIVVYNDGATPDRVDPIGMGGLTGPITIPGMMIGFGDGDLLQGTPGVVASLSPDVLVSKENSIAGFSGRGPNSGAPDIVKPDVAAPGVSILAAQTPTPNDGQTPGQLYQTISGTSMASPHVAGVGALLRQQFPDWTPAMVRSALMTTGRQNLTKTFGDTPADPFDIGAGHIAPRPSLDPGLAYHAGLLDYLSFLCVADTQSPLTSPADCDFLEGVTGVGDPSDLNLPSIGIAALAGTQTVTRTVTNVRRSRGHKWWFGRHGRGGWRHGHKRFYWVSVDEPPGVDVEVSPRLLFLAEGEAASYTVSFTVSDAAALDQWAFGSLTWRTFGAHDARSPIAVQPVAFDGPSDVEAAGTDGSTTFDVAFGFNGDYAASVAGLDEADVQEGIVAGPAGGFAGLDFFQIVVPPGVEHLRISTYDEDVSVLGDDIDLRLFQCTDNACSGGITQVAGSGGATSREQMDVASPVATGYLVVVDGFFTAGPDTTYKVFTHMVSGDEGNATVTAPGSAVIGPAQVSVDWSGLNAGTRYLGFVRHESGGSELARTFVAVDTQ